MRTVYTKNSNQLDTIISDDRLCVTSNDFEVGIDIVEIEDMASLMNDAVHVILTELEREAVAISAHPKSHMAGKFAAKEAVMKAIGKGMDKIDFVDIEVLNDLEGKPAVYLKGNALKYWKSGGFEALNISISHHAGVAVAIAVASRKRRYGLWT